MAKNYYSFDKRKKKISKEKEKKKKKRLRKLERKAPLPDGEANDTPDEENDVTTTEQSSF